MTCSTCRGAGSIHCVQAGTHEWWRCPACGGAGVRSLSGPPTIRTHFRSLEPIRKLERKAGIHTTELTP